MLPTCRRAADGYPVKPERRFSSFCLACKCVADRRMPGRHSKQTNGLPNHTMSRCAQRSWEATIWGKCGNDRKTPCFARNSHAKGENGWMRQTHLLFHRPAAVCDATTAPNAVLVTANCSQRASVAWREAPVCCVFCCGARPKAFDAQCSYGRKQEVAESFEKQQTHSLPEGDQH